MIKVLSIIIIFSTGIAVALENYVIVPNGTSKQVKSEFSMAQAIDSVRMREFSGPLKCTRFDQGLKEEFTRALSAELWFTATGTYLEFEGDSNVYSFAQSPGVGMQAGNMFLIGETKIDRFMTAKSGSANTLMFKGDLFQTKDGIVKYTDGVVYKCRK